MSVRIKPTDAELSDLESHLGYWLRRVSNHVSAAFARALQERRLSVAEWVALRFLYDRPGITAAELAHLLGMTRGAISKVLDKLVEKGLTVRVSRPEDQRSQALSLTSAGTDLLPKLVAIADNNDQRYFDCLTVAEKATLRTLLQKLVRHHRWSDVPVD